MIKKKYFNRGSLVLFLSLLLSQIAVSQNVVTGRVVDQDTKEGLIGVNVIVAGTTVGTATDLNSRFEIKSSGKIEKLVFSYTGYASKEVEVNGQKEVYVELEQTSIELDQVIVSASRSQQERKDAPVAMTKIQTQELLDLKANFHGQILNQASSVHFADFGNEQQSMAIRQPLSFSRTQIVILEDGVPVGPTSLTSTSDINEVNIEALKSLEVLRGPTSSLYGSEAVGGALNYITKNPALIPNAHIRFQASDLGYKKVGFEASNTFNKTGILMAGYWAQRRNGYRENSDMDKLSLTLKGVHNFNYKSKLTFSSTYNNFTTDFAGSLDSTQFYTDDAFNSQTFSYVENSSLRSSLRFDHFWNKSNKTFATVFYRRFIEEEIPSYRIQATGSYPNVSYEGEFVESDYSSFGLIAQHKKEFNFWSSSMIGGLSADFTPENYYSEVIDVVKTREGVYSEYSMTGEPVQDFQANLLNTAAYVHFVTSPVKNLKFLAALRYDRLDYEYDNHLTASDASGAPDTKNTFDHISPKIGLTYEIKKNIGTYANYSVGFAPPLFNQLYRTVTVPVLKPSEYNNYEFGGWMSLLKNKLYIDFALYQSYGKNEIVEVYEAGVSVNKSVGESSHKGIEYSANYKVFKDLTLRFSGSNSIHEFVDSFTGYEGNEMCFAPNFIANAGISYKPSYLKGFRIGMEMQKVGEYFMDEYNLETYGGYMIFNLRMGYQFRSFETWLNVLNIADELYAARASTSYYGSPSSPVIVRSYSPGIHRTFVLGIGYNFSGK